MGKMRKRARIVAPIVALVPVTAWTGDEWPGLPLHRPSVIVGVEDRVADPRCGFLAPEQAIDHPFRIERMPLGIEP